MNSIIELLYSCQIGLYLSWSLDFCIVRIVQVILFKIDCAIFYTNLQELFFQFISWTNWVNSGKFMGNSWISCQVMADMEKNCDNFITINLYVYFREYVCTLYIVNGFYLDGIPFSVVKAPQKVIYLWPLTRPTGLHAINFYSTIPELYIPGTLNIDKMLKFIYSEKATKFCEVSTKDLSDKSM